MDCQQIVFDCEALTGYFFSSECVKFRNLKETSMAGTAKKKKPAKKAAKKKATKKKK